MPLDRDGQEFALVNLLKACAKSKDLHRATALHAHILLLHSTLLEQSPYIASSLIHAYAKCGELSKAQNVLEELPVRGVVSWSALISGHTQHGQFHQALNCFERMQKEGLRGDAVTFTSILKAYGSIGDIEKGEKLHGEIASRGLLEKNIVLGNALVYMYAKCGMLAKAKQVLIELPARNIVTWSSLIAGYAQQGQGHEALECFTRMQREGISPNEVTLVCILKACGSIRAFDKGTQIHDEIAARGFLKTNVVLGNALVDMYAKCGVLENAQKVFDDLRIRDVVSWNALIAGYIEEGQGHQALNCYVCMQRENFPPNEVTLACILKACGSVRSLGKGKQIHNETVNNGMINKSIVLGNALVDMYAKCGMIVQAHRVLRELHVRDVVSWSALIAGYAEQGQGHEALDCLMQMQREEVFSPNESTFMSALKACGSIGDIEKGRQIHDEIVNRGLLVEHVMLGNALVDMYAKCGRLKKAHQVFEDLHIRDVVSWTSLIAGYVQQGKDYEALDCFALMQREGVSPNEITFNFILEACGSIGAAREGKQIDDTIVSMGLLEKSNMLGTALVDMYARCGMLAKAKEVLETLSIKDITAWNSIISGYVQHEEGYNSLFCLEQMRKEGVSPNEVTLVYILKACGSIGSIERGKEIHNEILRRRLLEENIVLGTALIDMYAKCGMLAKALEVLEELHVKDTISWNALIAGYAQHRQGLQALECFERMQREGLSPDEVTFACLLRACGSIGALDKGKQIHEEIDNRGFVEKNVMLGTALVDMYVKCGMFVKAQQVLKNLPVRDVISWNTIITGYAQAGNCSQVLGCFEEMEKEGLLPDEVTFLGVLNACSHSGKMDEAQLYYENMSEKYGITPNLEHHACMVMVFGCGGHFDKALSVIEMMRSCDHPSVWLALLGACKKWGNVKLGRLACHQAIQYGFDLSASYVLMSNIDAAAGIHMSHDADKLEKSCC